MEIALDAPNLGELEKEALVRCIDSGYVSTFGPFVSEFESRFSDFLGVRSAVAVQSGSEGLFLTLLQAGVGPGDEVILPVMSFVASANPVVRLGARPVFVDVDPSTWNIDPEAVESAITDRTKVILPVHLYGNPCDMERIMAVAAHHGCVVVEDAAESLGASFGSTMTGAFGKFGVFSFNGNKIITTGGGGAVVVEDASDEAHIRHLINQARDVAKGYYHTEIGYNLSMTNLEASLGLAQLARLSAFLDRKRDHARRYREGFSVVPTVTLQEESAGARSSWWLTSVKVSSERDISDIQTGLRAKGVPTRRLFPPIVEFPPYRQYATDVYPHACDLYDRGLNLPSSTVNGEREIEHVIAALLDVIGST